MRAGVGVLRPSGRGRRSLDERACEDLRAMSLRRTSEEVRTMKTALALCVALAMIASASGATFTSAVLGLTFQHPDNWKVITKKGDTRITMPLDNGDVAQLLIFPRSFNSDIDLWNSVERDIANQEKRTVDSQTQEEIMGVPLLLTRVKYTEKGRAMESLSGLVYSATPRKLLFRLIASESSFDKAEQAWRSALNTLRTSDGKLPKAEDPNRKVTPEEVKAAAEGPTKISQIQPDKPKRTVFHKGQVAIDASAAGHKVQLRVPTGWLGRRDADGSVTLTHPELSAPLKVSILSSLDSDEPDRALDRAAVGSLGAFTVVLEREDTKAVANLAGAIVQQVWRKGTADKGSITSCDAIGVTGDYYWVFSYRGTLPVPATKDARLLEALIKVMSVELLQ